MTTMADGTEVVQSLEKAHLEHPPLLVVDRLTAYLDSRGLGSGRLAWQRIGDGQSNVTYRINRGRDAFVLRRGPRPPFPRSTHNMAREAAILRALRPHGVPVPQVLDVCVDDGVLGTPFYLMQWLDGTVITSQVPAELDTREQRRATTDVMLDALAHLHAVDVSEPDVASLGRPDGYLARQVSRFMNLWQANSGRDLPEVAQLGSWLGRNMPSSQRASVVHGDYRLGNIMFARNAPAAPVAILDWEMATLGDPLSDVGYLTATYSEPGSPSSPLSLSPVTSLPGYHRRSELVAGYEERTGLDMSSIGWYQVLALWKAAVFCEAIYTRWLKGERPGDTFGPQLTTGVPELLEQASQLAA